MRVKRTNVLDIETVEDTLDRMEVEADPYLDFDEVVDFFTVRGRPLALDYAKRGKNKPLQEEKVPESMLIQS